MALSSFMSSALAASTSAAAAEPGDLKIRGCESFGAAKDAARDNRDKMANVRTVNSATLGTSFPTVKRMGISLVSREEELRLWTIAIIGEPPPPSADLDHRRRRAYPTSSAATTTAETPAASASP
jgi:hypothetical protein